jgi:heptosyltransferase-2
MKGSRQFFFEKKNQKTFANLGSMAVFQPRPGMGDLIWHLPIIRAIAGDNPITLITKRSTQADALLANDPAIKQIIWFDRNPRQGRGRHDGLLGFPRLVATLRALQLDTCVLLHHGASLAAAMACAGIPNRAAYGYAAAQRRWLTTGPYLSGDIQFAEAFLQAQAFAKAAGFPDLPEPNIQSDPAAHARVASQLAHLPRPWTVLGIGSHGANRQWGAANFAILATALLARSPGTVILLAAAHEAGHAEAIHTQAGHTPRIHAALGWPLQDVTALLATADTFIGNDSGPLNLRAAAGQPAYALFGASGPLPHSRRIIPIIPPAGPRAGMSAITPQSVLDTLP